jgi:hypothetical protein
MKITGDKPSRWTVLLRPAFSTEIRKYQYYIEKEKKESINLIKKAFSDRDEKMFKEGEQRYQNEERKEKKIMEILEDNNKKKINMSENIFKVRRELYLLRHKRYNNRKEFTKDDKTKMDNLNNKIRQMTKEQLEFNKNISMSMKQYSINIPSVQQQGSYPDPPNISTLAISSRKRRIIFDETRISKDTDKNTNNTNSNTNNTNNTNSNSNENYDTNETEDTNQDGGDIKIIKL